MPVYREQYDRTLRWYDRFSATDQGRAHDAASENYIDEIYAFFLNCYHLKDWIKHDPAVPTTVKQAVEDWISTDPSLKLCADICNSLKHLLLTSSRSGGIPAFGAKSFSLALGPGLPTTISLKYEIDTASGPKDAYQLATNCMSAWNWFLSLHGL
jgi:hypothetical protein